MGQEAPYIEELVKALDQAKAAITTRDYDAAEAYMRMVEVLTPLVNTIVPNGAASGGIPMDAPQAQVEEVALGDDPPEVALSKGQQKRAEIAARRASRQG